jgi:ABC-2 type transport system ATP-binding protein
MTIALSIESLTVRHGLTTAVDALNLEVRQGEAFGFLGPNGAGKSTTISHLLGLIRPDAGWRASSGSICARPSRP